MSDPKTMTAIVRTPRQVQSFEGIPSALIPGVDGDMGVLPQHAPMIVGLRSGVAVIGDQCFEISAGVADVRGDKVTLYLEHFTPAQS